MLAAKAKETRRKCSPKKRKKKQGLRSIIANFSRNFRRSPNKTKKRSSRRISQIFRDILDEEKKGHDLGPFLTKQKIVLSTAEDSVFSRTWRLRGLGQELDLQGQGLQNVSSNTPPLADVLINSLFFNKG